MENIKHIARGQFINKEVALNSLGGGFQIGQEDFI
jgi:hypothetical protein